MYMYVVMSTCFIHAFYIYIYLYLLLLFECSVVNNLGDNLTLELHRVQMLFGHKLVGLATIPLHSIRHSNRVNLYRVQKLFLITREHHVFEPSACELIYCIPGNI